MVESILFFPFTFFMVHMFTKNCYKSSLVANFYENPHPADNLDKIWTGQVPKKYNRVFEDFSKLMPEDVFSHVKKQGWCY